MVTSSSSAEGTGALTVQIRFTAGWCDLRLETASDHIGIRATALADFFGDLVRSVRDLAEGRRAVSCMWGGEPDGSFIELAAGAPASLCGVVVHSFGDSNWVDNLRAQWIPVRGPVQFSTLVSFGAAINAFCSAFRDVQVNDVDRSGYITEWGWLFPLVEFHELQRLALSHGYKAQPTREILRR